MRHHHVSWLPLGLVMKGAGGNGRCVCFVLIEGTRALTARWGFREREQRLTWSAMIEGGPSLPWSFIEALERIDVGVLVIQDDAERGALHLGERMASLLGRTLSELRGGDALALLAPAEGRSLEGLRALVERRTQVQSWSAWVGRPERGQVLVEVLVQRALCDGAPALVCTARQVPRDDAQGIADNRAHIFIEQGREPMALWEGYGALFVNRACLQMLSMSEESAAAWVPLPQIVASMESAVLFESLAQRALLGEALVSDTIELSGTHGEPVRVLATVSMVEAAGRKATLYRFSAPDEAMAQDASPAALALLAAGVVHEVNNPLTYVSLSLDALHRKLSASQAPLPSEEILGLLQEGRRGAERAREIVRQISVFSRELVAKRVAMIRVDGMIESARRLTQHHWAPSAELMIEIDRRAGALHVNKQVEQVLVNLLVNAAQAMPVRAKSESWIKLQAWQLSATQVCIEVSDNGQGMAPEVLERVFLPFFTTKAVGVGTGLGLPISRRILIALGGNISVRSAEGEGTVVSITVPGTELAPEDVQRMRARWGASGRVLLIVDEPRCAREHMAALSCVHEVIVADSAQSALELLGRLENIDVILCDAGVQDLRAAVFFDTVAIRWPGRERRIAFIGGAGEEADEDEVPGSEQVSSSKLLALVDGVLRRAGATQDMVAGE